MARKRLGEILIEQSSITDDQLMEALKYQKEHNGRLGAILVHLKYCHSSDVVNAVIEQLKSLNLASLSDYVVDTSVIPLVDYEYSKQNDLIPIEKDGTIVLVAASEHLTPQQVSYLEKTTGYSIKEFIIDKKIITNAIEEYYYPLLIKKRNFLDDDRVRISLISSLLLFILLFLVCNYKDNINEIISESKNKPMKKVIIEEIDPLEMISDDDESITELSNYLSEIQENTKDEIMTISGNEYRNINDIRKVLFFHFDELFRYYNLKLRRNPNISGKIIFEITIHYQGYISEIQVIQSSIKDNQFILGAKEIIKKWNFGKINENKDVKVRFPFDFNLKR